MTTEQEKAQMEEKAEATLEPESEAPTLEAEQPEGTPEPISELPGEEITSEAQEVETKTVQQELAEQVKSCMSGGGSCGGLGSKFDEAAEELGIEVNELIDQVFEIITGKQV